MFDNICKPMFEQKNKMVTKWGKDNTGKISYFFNRQGFRSQIAYDFVPKYAFFGSSSIFGIGVNEDDTMVSYFPKSHNYGLAGEYLNIHSVQNLENFVKSCLYTNEVKIIFFWVERSTENILNLSNIVKKLHPNVIQISQGKKYPNIINLMPEIDYDVTCTHPGPKTHYLWAKTIKLLCNI